MTVYLNQVGQPRGVVSVWRLHPEPGSKWYVKGPHWRFCTDAACGLEHVDYEPFKPMSGQVGQTVRTKRGQE